MSEIIVYTHQNCLKKNNGIGHPERKERLETILSSISQIKDLNIEIKSAPEASLDVIDYVHPKKYVEEIFSKIPKEGLIGVEQEPYADTLLCPNSKEAILRACGSGIAAADDLIKFNKKIFCAVRPPGHHAETVRANGFCFINNIAVTARYLQKKYSVGKIAIIDFDVHHGNGTQEIFYKDPSVAYGSIHEFPLFPGTGAENETGVGNIFNATVKAGTNGRDFINILNQKVLNKIDKFKPEIILVSAGFDAHTRDLLSHTNVNSEEYFEITKNIAGLANIHCNGKIISFLEGGYDLIALSESIKEHINGLL